ncbi:MAG: phosphatase PAP2 family protein, partial [Endomicrobiales bacterium]
ALAIAFLVFLPVVAWNLHNNFASFGFQLSHGFGKKAPQFSLELLGRCLGAQAGYLSPLLFFAYWAALIGLGRRFLRDRDEKALLLFSFSFPTLFLFNGIASFNEILPHWPAMGYFVLSIAVAAYAAQFWKNTAFRAFSVTAWSLGLALTVLVPLQALYKVLAPELFMPKEEAAKIEDGITRAEKVDITNELYGWREAGRKIAQILEQAPEPKPFVFTHRHYIASQLSFYIPGRPRVWCLSDRVDAYDFWQRELGPLDGRDGIFVTNDFFYVEPEGIFPFVSWQKVAPVEVFRAGRKIRIFSITYGRKFNAGALSPEYTAAGVAGPSLSLREGLVKLDHGIFWLFNRDLRNPLGDAIMWPVTKADTALGVNTGLVVLILFIGVMLRAYRRDKFWPEFILAIGIIGVGGIVVHLMKDAFDRMRPLAVFGSQVHLFHEHLERGSFPSGHTQIAFSAAAFLTSRVKKFWWLFYAIAAFMGLSRMYVGMHFPLDVLGGAVIGVTVAWVMIRLVKIE